MGFVSSEKPADKYDVTDAYRERLALALSAVSNAVLKVAAKHGPNYNSYHEMYGVLLEEVDEVWEEVKRKQQSQDAVGRELLDVAAVALRGLVQYMGLQVVPTPSPRAVDWVVTKEREPDSCRNVIGRKDYGPTAVPRYFDIYAYCNGTLGEWFKYPQGTRLPAPPDLWRELQPEEVPVEDKPMTIGLADASEPGHPLSVPVSALKKCLRSFSYEARTQIADEAKIHFAFLEAFTLGIIDKNNNLAPDQFKRVVVAGRKLFPGLFI